MKNRKTAITLILLIVSSFSIFAKSQKQELLSTTLSGLKLSAGYTNAFSLYNMDIYSKVAAGGFLDFEYTLLPELAGGLDIGFYGKASYQNFIPYNLQLNRLDSFTFSGGLFGQKNFSNDISIFLSAGAGFMINQLDFTSAEGSDIQDVYYDFALESDFYIRKKIIGNKTINLLAGPGCHFSFYNEKSKNFCTLGPEFSLSLDFKPVKTK